jgi:hypothetical protein
MMKYGGSGCVDAARDSSCPVDAGKTVCSWTADSWTSERGALGATMAANVVVGFSQVGLDPPSRNT